mgnify:CR=1 FL=1
MREHTLECHSGVFSKEKQNDYEFFQLNTHSKVLRRQLEESILLDWAQGKGVLKLGKRIFKVSRAVLNSKFEHWRPQAVFICGR